MQQKWLILLILIFFESSFYAKAEDLLSDEQGPTAEEAVATVTAGEDFLTQSYVVPTDPTTTPKPVPSEVDILNEIFGTSDIVPPAAEKPAVQKTFTPTTGVQRTDQQPLLTPLPEIMLAISDEKTLVPKKVPFAPTGFADQALSYAASDMVSSTNMPREIRITYYENQSGLNAQALKWVKAFAIRVVRDPRLIAEIRVSENQWDLQQKRLMLLLQILKEEGVSVHQIRVYKSDRDPNNILMGYSYNDGLTKMGETTKGKEQKIIDW